MRRATGPPYTASPVGDRVHRAHDLLAVRALDEVAARPGAERGEDVLVVLVHRQHEDRAAPAVPRSSRRVAATPSRSGIDRSVMTTSGRCSAAAVSSAAPSPTAGDDVDRLGLVEDGRQAVAVHRVVVGKRRRAPS